MARHDSPYGRIVSNWRREGDRVTMDMTIPANTTAMVHVPAKDAAGIRESGRPLNEAPGVEWLGVQDGNAVLRVVSGMGQRSGLKLMM